MTSIWVSNSISNWTAQSQGGHIFGPEWIRTYQIWERARELIDDAKSEFALADGVANLKRALNHRLKLIEEYYSFKNIEISNKPTSYLELLERYDIVRPFIMQILLKIRNDIEHNDVAPPTIERCKEFLDVVWYFIKSTDPITQVQQNDPVFRLLDNEGFETQYWYSVDINFEKAAKMHITGWFPDNILYSVAKEGTSKVIIETMKTNIEKLNEIKKQEKEIDTYLMEEYKARLDTDICIRGELLPTPDVRLAIIKKVLICF